MNVPPPGPTNSVVIQRSAGGIAITVMIQEYGPPDESVLDWPDTISRATLFVEEIIREDDDSTGEAPG